MEEEETDRNKGGKRQPKTQNVKRDRERKRTRPEKRKKEDEL